jgi:hypothetical protein
MSAKEYTKQSPILNDGWTKKVPYVEFRIYQKKRCGTKDEKVEIMGMDVVKS